MTLGKGKAARRKRARSPRYGRRSELAPLDVARWKALEVARLRAIVAAVYGARLRDCPYRAGPMREAWLQVVRKWRLALRANVPRGTEGRKP